MILHHGDCMKFMEDKDFGFDLCITRPVFGIPDMSEDDYWEWQRDFLDLLAKRANHGAQLFYAHRQRHVNGEYYHPIFQISSASWTLHQEINLIEKFGHFSSEKALRVNEEKIFWLYKDIPHINEPEIFINTSILIEKNINDYAFAAPLYFVENLIKQFAKPGDVIFDPFMGSGTTGLAAKNLGFDFIGCELNEEIYEIAKEKIKADN